MSWDSTADALKASLAVPLAAALDIDPAAALTLIAWDTEPDSVSETIVRLSVVSDVEDGDRIPLVDPQTFETTEIREATASIQILVESGEAGEAVSVARKLSFWLGRRDTRDALAAEGLAAVGPPEQTRTARFFRDGYEIGSAFFEIAIRYREQEETGSALDAATGLSLEGTTDGSIVYDETISSI